MRAPFLVAVCVLLVPVAAAEGMDLQAVGMHMAQSHGVAGFQWDDEGAVGMRYWVNGTEARSVETVWTVCISNDAKTIYYCERHPLAP